MTPLTLFHELSEIAEVLRALAEDEGRPQQRVILATVAARLDWLTETIPAMAYAMAPPQEEDAS